MLIFFKKIICLCASVAIKQGFSIYCHLGLFFLCIGRAVSINNLTQPSEAIARLIRVTVPTVYEIIRDSRIQVQNPRYRTSLIRTDVHILLH